MLDVEQLAAGGAGGARWAARRLSSTAALHICLRCPGMRGMTPKQAGCRRLQPRCRRVVQSRSALVVSGRGAGTTKPCRSVRGSVGSGLLPFQHLHSAVTATCSLSLNWTLQWRADCSGSTMLGAPRCTAGSWEAVGTRSVPGPTFAEEPSAHIQRLITILRLGLHATVADNNPAAHPANLPALCRLVEAAPSL